MTNHTIGPWENKGQRASDGRFIVAQEGSGGNAVCEVFTGTPDKQGNLSIGEANARLIAQAPEMYELLRHILTADGIPHSTAPGPMSRKDIAWTKTVYSEARRIKAAIDVE